MTHLKLQSHILFTIPQLPLSRWYRIDTNLKYENRDLPLLVVLTVPSPCRPHPVLHPWNQRIDVDLLVIIPFQSSSVLVIRQSCEGAVYRLFSTMLIPALWRRPETLHGDSHLRWPCIPSPQEVGRSHHRQDGSAGLHLWLCWPLKPAATAALSHFQPPKD